MRRQHRRGFTITELLVAMALIIFIMYILAEAFSAGSTAFRNLKAVGDMNEKLRTASTTLRKYLQSDHFEGRKRLSDPDFWKDGPPREGFLRIYHGSAAQPTSTSAYYFEGGDQENNPSFRATDHALHFSVKLRGNNRGDYFRASLPALLSAGPPPVVNPLLQLPLLDTRFQEPLPTPVTATTMGTLTSSWSEVVVYLRNDFGDLSEDVENTKPGVAPQNLYSLYIRQRLCVPDNDLLGTTRVPIGLYPQHAEMSCHADPLSAGNLYFNSPADLAMPARRFGSGNAAPSPVQGGVNFQALGTDNPAFEGNDVLLTNVLSFEVRVLLDRQQWNAFYALAGNPQPYDFVGLHHPAIQWFTGGNPAFAGGGPQVFDTWSSGKDDVYDYSNWTNPGAVTSIPLYRSGNQAHRIRLIALQITIRIWDSRTKQTRQTSIVVDL